MASRLKRSNCPKWNFFSKSNKIFMYLFAPFILQNIKRILWADPELSGCAIFSHKMAHLSWTIFFWYKPLLLLSSTYWPFSLSKIFWSTYRPLSLSRIFKNYYSRSRVKRMCHIWAQNGPFAPNKIFFGKLLISFSSTY